MKLTFGSFRETCEKWWHDGLLYATIFQRILDVLIYGSKYANQKGRRNRKFPE